MMNHAAVSDVLRQPVSALSRDTTFLSCVAPILAHVFGIVDDSSVVREAIGGPSLDVDALLSADLTSLAGPPTSSGLSTSSGLDGAGDVPDSPDRTGELGLLDALRDVEVQARRLAAVSVNLTGEIERRGIAGQVGRVGGSDVHRDRGASPARGRISGCRGS